MRLALTSLTVLLMLGVAGLAQRAGQNGAGRPKAAPQKNQAPQAQAAQPAAQPVRSSMTLAQIESFWKMARTKEDFAAVGKAFAALIAANPTNIEFRLREGDLYRERYNAPEAEVSYESALEIDPKSIAAYLRLAEVYADDFDTKAVEAADKALEIDPKTYHAHEIKARVALEDDQRKKAIEEADAALAIQPDALEATAIHATLDLLEDKESPWLAKIGNRGAGYETIAKFLVINRRYEDGILYYRKAVATQPDLWSAHSQLGVNLMRLGRDEEGRKELTLAYDNSFRDAATANTLNLLDTYKDFETFTTPKTSIRLHKTEAAVLLPYVQGVLDHAMAVYEKKYQFKIDKPIQVEVYPKHGDFEVRVMGLPGIGGILGVTFNTVVAMDSPSSRKTGEFHWASTLWHELSHVYMLTITNERTPRWFTEGVAVHEETATYPDWGDRLSPNIIKAIRDKKLLPIADMDRGFVHPTFQGQVIVSYYEGGKICDYIAARWGESKLLDMAHEFAKNRTTVDVVREQLGIAPEDFDKDFIASIEKETARTVAGFEGWVKGMGELNELAKDAKAEKADEIIAKARPLEAVYPDFVEIGNAYSLIADACLMKNDKACAIDELSRYSKQGGRDADDIKKLAKLLDEAGKKKEAAAALERMNFVYPLDAELHDRLGNLLLDTHDAAGATREFQALIALHPLDVAGSHYGLARAYQAAGQNDKAREEAVTALEAAPEFRPAQKLLLDVTK